MIKLIDILQEAKQVGDVYHFTPTYNLYSILNDGFLKPNYEQQVSTTRNKNVDLIPFFDNDSLDNVSRITLDGNKISNNFKIKPYHYDEDVPPSKRGPAYLNKIEFEEQIITNGKNLPIYPYLKRIDIFTSDKEDSNIVEIESILKKKNIPLTIHNI